MLTVVDEFSCKSISTETVEKCLLQLFTVFGMVSYMHSVRGSSLISDELHNNLLSYNVVTSRSKHPIIHVEMGKLNVIMASYGKQ